MERKQASKRHEVALEQDAAEEAASAGGELQAVDDCNFRLYGIKIIVTCDS